MRQSPVDQTKYFEISVVWNSQPVTSFTFFMYMYVELQITCTCISQLCKYITGEKPICGNNLHICVYGCEIKKEMSPITHCVYILKKCPWSMPVLHAVSSSLFVKLINFTQFLQHVCHVWLLFTWKNAVKQCSIIKVTKALLCIHGFKSYIPNYVDY